MVFDPHGAGGRGDYLVCCKEKTKNEVWENSFFSRRRARPVDAARYEPRANLIRHGESQEAGLSFEPPDAY